MINENRPQAFLIVAQNISKHTLKLYRNIRSATEGQGDVFILYHSKGNSTPLVPEGVTVETFTNDVLKDLNYKPIRTKLVPGSNHFPVLQFYLSHPQYLHYWCIEDDVAFSGNWDEFFKNIPPGLNYDFITSHIRRYKDVPDWFWWDSYRAPGEDFDENMISSFNPIYRISNKALEYIDASLKKGYRGHHEVLLPTLLKKANFQIADFSTEINHITPNLSFCTLGTMRWKPVFFAVGNKKNKLYHPVKGRFEWKQLKEYITRTFKNKKEYLT